MIAEKGATVIRHLNRQKEWDAYQFSLIETDGKKCTLSCSTSGTEEEFIEFLEVVSKMVGFDYIERLEPVYNEIIDLG